MPTTDYLPVIIHDADAIESIEVSISERTHPRLFRERVSYFESFGFSQEEAKERALDPVELELYHSPAGAVFAVCAETVEIAPPGIVVDPYTGMSMKDPEG